MVGFILQGLLCMPCCYARLQNIVYPVWGQLWHEKKIEPARELVESHLIYVFNCKRSCMYVLLMGMEALKLVRAPDKCDSSSSFVSCMCHSCSYDKCIMRLSWLEFYAGKFNSVIQCNTCALITDLRILFKTVVQTEIQTPYSLLEHHW